MNNKAMEKIQGNREIPEVKVGDTVKLHLKIKEAGKERIQIFEGIVLSQKGRGTNKTLTVRKVSFGIGVEKIVPLNSTTLDRLEVVKRGKRVRRSKLYYMRDKIGKKAMDIGLTERMQEEYVDEAVEAEKEKEKKEKEEKEEDKESNDTASPDSSSDDTSDKTESSSSDETSAETDKKK